MDPVDSSKRPAEWASAMSKRAEILSLGARVLSSSREQKTSPAQRVFGQLAARLQSLSELMRNVEESVHQQGLASLQGQLLEEELTAEEKLVQEFTGRCSLYLLMCSPRIIRELQESGKRLGKAIEGISGELELDQVDEVFVKPTSDDEALMDSLDEGMLDTIVIDNGLCSKLASQIASSVGLEFSSNEFKQEIQKLREEKSLAEDRGGKVHALYLEQFLLILDRAVQFSSRSSDEEESQRSRKKEMMLNSVSISGRDAPMLPLQPFICPITRDVMRDPVQIASGQTYEREAIERWFAEGNTRCPVMGEEVNSTQMKSNFALKQSIAEWRERNFEARLHGVARRLVEVGVGVGFGVGDDAAEDEVRVVREVRSICEQEPLNKYKVGEMGLITPMVKLVASRDAEVRKETLASLSVLARDNLENQETMVNEGIIEMLVHSLTRQKSDLQEAIVLMKILSENPNTAEKISHAQGAVVFLVTLLGSDNEELSQSIKAILENVPTSDENVVIMAEANLMRPLATRIVEGSAESRIVMAKALAGMHLPLSSKTSVATDDVLRSLLKMTGGSSSSEEAALGALQNLTSVSSIAEAVIRLQGFRQLEHKLSLVKSSEAFKIGAARVLADLSTVAGDVWGCSEEALEELETYIYKFLGFMGSIAPVVVQASLLQALLRLCSGKSVGEFTIKKLGENNAMQLFLPLLKRSSEAPARKPAMELFCLLSKRFKEAAGAAAKQKPEIFLELLRELSDDPQRSELLSIAASLEDGNLLLEQTMQEQAGFVRVVTELLVNSQDANTIQPALKIVLKLARIGGIETQKRMAELGMVERLVKLLDAGRSREIRGGAAWILAEMASNTWELIRNSKNDKKKKNIGARSSKSFLALCLPWLVQRDSPRVCRVHRWQCTARGTFCLVEAEGVAPLVALLREAVAWRDDGEDVAAGALAALAALTGVGEGEGGGREACAVIDRCKGVAAVIAAVSGGGGEAQRYALEILERVFEEEEFCQQYGGAAQMHVIYAAQTGDVRSKRTAGRILRKLELIHSQSNYLALSTT